MDELMDPKTWQLGTGDLVQQIAMLAWLTNGDEAKPYFELVTKGRVLGELYHRMTGQSEVDRLQGAIVLAIVDYVKKNPRATEDQLAKFIQQQIEVFQLALRAM